MKNTPPKITKRARKRIRVEALREEDIERLRKVSVDLMKCAHSAHVTENLRKAAVQVMARMNGAIVGTRVTRDLELETCKTGMLFTDINAGDNLSNGVEYCAVGLIVEDMRTIPTGSPSGKDFVVEFIDPWGDHHRAWRSVKDVTIKHISEIDAELLRVAYTRAEQISTL